VGHGVNGFAGRTQEVSGVVYRQQVWKAAVKEITGGNAPGPALENGFVQASVSLA